MHIQHKLDQGALQPGARPDKEGEPGAGHPGRPPEIQDTQPLGQLAGLLARFRVAADPRLAAP